MPGGLRTACSDRLESEGGIALLSNATAAPGKTGAAAKARAVQVGQPLRGDLERAFVRAFQERHGKRPGECWRPARPMPSMAHIVSERPSLPPTSATPPQPIPCRPSLPCEPIDASRLGPIAVLEFHSGGTTFALTDAAVRLMQRSIRAGRCPDAPYSDVAAGACALASGVRQLLLPGTWLQNNPKRPFGAWPIGGPLISYHRLPPHVATCWARHAGRVGADAECEPCDDPVSAV